MPLQFTYRPPPINGHLLIHAAKSAAELAGAHALLAASQPLVPVDEGALVASGHVEHDELGAKVVYSALSPEGYDYAARQHEELDFHHDQGEAKYLEKPMHTAHVLVGEAMATVLRQAV